MSAIPGGAVTFDILSRASDAGVREMERRIQKAVTDAKRTKIVLPVEADTKRLQQQLRQAKEMQAAHMRAEGFGGAGGRSGAPGWLSGAKASPVGGGDSEPYQKIIKAAVVLRGVTAAIEATNGLIDEHYAKQSGNLDRIVAAEQQRAQTLRSIPIAGALGGGIRDLFQGADRAAIAQTMDDAASGDKKAEFMARQNDRIRAERETLKAMRFQAMGERGATGTQIELAGVRDTLKDAQPGKVTDALRKREIDLAARDHAEREVLEERHASNIARIREDAAVEMLRAEGWALAAEREELISGFRQTDRDLELAAKEATARGDIAGAARLRQQAGEVQAAQGARLMAHDAAQATEEARRLEEAGTDAAGFMSGAGAATVERHDRNRDIAIERRSIDAETREIMLRSKGQDERADMEAIKARALQELEVTESPVLRAAIAGRAEAELKAMLNSKGAGALVSNAGLTSFGSVPGQEAAVERVLRGDILRTLREIRDKENLARAS